ncbi:MAG: hypothetical protein ACKV22_34790 [Bryobacteraceae bacterium]
MSTIGNQDQPPNIPPPIHSPRRVDEHPSRRSRSRVGLGLAVLCVFAAAGCGAWYYDSRLNQHDSLLSAMRALPVQLSEFQDRLFKAEKQLVVFPKEIDSLRAQIAGTQQSLAQKVEQARRSVGDMSISVRREFQEALDVRERAAETRLRRLEVGQQSEVARAASLEQEVAQLRQRLAAVTQDVTYVQNAAALDSQRLRQEVRRSDDRLTRVVSFNSRPRERFETWKGKTQEIAPGIFLHITQTDPRYRRFKGWLQLPDQGKILWLRDESMLQPVAFHAGKQSLRHDLSIQPTKEESGSHSLRRWSVPGATNFC